MAPPQGLLAEFDGLNHQFRGEALRYAKFLRDLNQLHVLEAVHFECPPSPAGQLSHGFLKQGEFVPGLRTRLLGRFVARYKFGCNGSFGCENATLAAIPPLAIQREVMDYPEEIAGRFLKSARASGRAEAQPGILHHILSFCRITSDPRRVTEKVRLGCKK